MAHLPDLQFEETSAPPLEESILPVRSGSGPGQRQVHRPELSNKVPPGVEEDQASLARPELWARSWHADPWSFEAFCFSKASSTGEIAFTSNQDPLYGSHYPQRRGSFPRINGITCFRINGITFVQIFRINGITFFLQVVKSK